MVVRQTCRVSSELNKARSITLCGGTGGLCSMTYPIGQSTHSPLPERKTTTSGDQTSDDPGASALEVRLHLRSGGANQDLDQEQHEPADPAAERSWLRQCRSVGDRTGEERHDQRAAETIHLRLRPCRQPDLGAGRKQNDRQHAQQCHEL